MRLLYNDFGSNKGHLRKHIERIHEGKKDFECNICNYSCGKISDLKVHIKLVHEGKKRLKCNICGRSFGLKKTLRRHLQMVHENKIILRLEKAILQMQPLGNL